MQELCATKRNRAVFNKNDNKIFVNYIEKILKNYL